ncbi:hypothetical protein ACRUZW_26015 [Mycobacterium colombiense]
MVTVAWVSGVVVSVLTGWFFAVSGAMFAVAVLLRGIIRRFD